MIMPEDHFATNPPASPIVPQMLQRSHGPAPSVTSMTEPGMAGQGAYTARAVDGYTQPERADFRNQYGDHPYATSAPPRAQPVPLQERPQYVFGAAPAPPLDQSFQAQDPYLAHEKYQYPGDDYNEGQGPYPQTEHVYNAEDYSGYHAYSPETVQHASYGGAHARPKSTNSEDAYGGM